MSYLSFKGRDILVVDMLFSSVSSSCRSEDGRVSTQLARVERSMEANRSRSGISVRSDEIMFITTGDEFVTSSGDGCMCGEKPRSFS
jgi:hypothetical protein